MNSCMKLIAVVWILPGAALAQIGVDVDNTTATASTAAPQTALPEALYAAPTRLDRIGRIVAPVMLNGRGPFRFVVDTGANRSVITTQLASALGLEASHDNAVTLRGVTGATIVPTVSIDRFQTGDLVQSSLQLPVLETVMSQADGILGMEGFEDKRITVDFVRDRIEISRSLRQRAPATYLTLPARIRFGRLMVVDAKVGNVRTKAIIDTGAERTLGNMALREALLRRRNAGNTQATHVIGLSMEQQSAHTIRTPPISMGHAEISNVEVVYGDIDVFRLWELEDRPALLLGMDVLGTLKTLIIDYRMREVQIRTR
jgi:predicted aspartyl protease